jgi:3-(methylthio)propanoyl-CoA dehydrogenase
MHAYTPPLDEIRFVLGSVLDQAAIAAVPRWSGLGEELRDAILEEAGRFAATVLAPLNRSGDRSGCRLDAAGGVHTPEGFSAAYTQFVAAGWNALAAPGPYGGQDLPGCLATATQELWQAANMAFALCPMLTASAISAIHRHAAPELRAIYLPKLVSGEWTGTMNLTEPQAGSDLAAIRTRAEPDGAHYRLHGQKIYITWGEHDCAENIVHLVLARLPDAAPGVKGLSLFLVPRHLPDIAGRPSVRNDLRCVGLERKLGIHASPTCTLSFGEGAGAIGHLLGAPGDGLACMFTMMNEARHKVGVQGLAISERALQQASAYARQRVQGQPIGTTGRRPIGDHPDVRRLLLTMRTGVDAMRLLCYYAAWCMDLGAHHDDPPERARLQARADLLIPIVKGWCTELAVELTSLGVQVHGGSGYIEDSGAAQHLRDARITAIYEGTTAIQANDLIGRKTHRDGGAALHALIAELRADTQALAVQTPAAQRLATGIARALDRLAASATRIAERHGSDPAGTAAVAVPYLLQAGYALGGAFMGRAALRAATRATPDTARQKLELARYYGDHLLPRAEALAHTVAATDDPARPIV